MAKPKPSLFANTAPVASNATFTMTTDDFGLDMTLTATDADPLTFILVDDNTSGDLMDDDDGEFYYEDYNQVVATETFTFKVNDGTVDSNIATVTINIVDPNGGGTNASPVATAQSVTTPQDTAKSITLSATDADNDPLTYSVVTQPSHGTLTGTAPTLTYTPTTGYSGSDSFTFKTNDGTVDSSPATISITVELGNVAPVTENQTLQTNMNIDLDVVLSATDQNNDPLTYSVVTQPSHGTLTGTAPNLVYIPTLNFVGSDSFTFKANDSEFDSNISTITITVIEVNTPPVAHPITVHTAYDFAHDIDLFASDADGDTIVYQLYTLPQHGSLLGVAPHFTYIPDQNWSGYDMFSYRVFDGEDYSSETFVDINNTGRIDPMITEENDAFGTSVAVYNNKVAIGAINAGEYGEVTVYQKDAKNNWINKDILIANDGNSNDSFACSVAMSNSFIAVGAKNSAGKGAVYLYKLISGKWQQTAKLTASDATTSDQFGFAVTMNDNYLYVSAPNRSTATENRSGAVYVFKYNLTTATWTEIAILTASDASSYSHFGSALAIAGDNLVVGADGYDPDSTSAGSAYLFARQANDTWIQTNILTASNAGAGDNFGCSVSIENNTVVVGARYYDVTTGNEGAVYIFNKNATGNWNESSQIVAGDAAQNDCFGHAVSIHNNIIAIGAYSVDNTAVDSGAVYLFTLNTSTNLWEQKMKQITIPQVTGSYMGNAVVAADNFALTGVVADNGFGSNAGTAWFCYYPHTATPQTLILTNSMTTNLTLTAQGSTINNLTYQLMTPPSAGILSGIAPNLTYTANPQTWTDSFTFLVTNGTYYSPIATVTINVADSDSDGIPDHWEIANSLNPNNASDATADPDNDGLTNLQEYQQQTNPNSADTDGDGLSDADEINTHNTDPNKVDTDSDSLSDGDEVNIYHTNPNNQDSDGDNMPDGWEAQYHLMLSPIINDATADPDNDGVDNYTEFLQGRNPTKGAIIDTNNTLNLIIFTPTN